MWNTEILTIVRHLINDTDCEPTYPDERIEQTILVAAQLVSTEIDFAQTYTINVERNQLSPDPTDSAAKDDGFINLVSLKAACIIVGSEYKAHSKSSIRISDGPSSIDMGGVAQNFKGLYDTVCKQYEQAKMNFTSINNNVGQAVLSPYGYYWSR
jgi:hypothetical protein